MAISINLELHVIATSIIYLAFFFFKMAHGITPKQPKRDSSSCIESKAYLGDLPFSTGMLSTGGIETPAYRHAKQYISSLAHSAAA